MPESTVARKPRKKRIPETAEAKTKAGTETTTEDREPVRVPRPGDMVLVSPHWGEDTSVPMVVSHLHDDGTVSGVVLTAFPGKIGESKPAQVYMNLAQGDGPRTWRWPG